ncbi:MAG: hypothetical protein EHM61_06605, partial [Acidobacteria bacterium]
MASEVRLPDSAVNSDPSQGSVHVSWPDSAIAAGLSSSKEPEDSPLERVRPRGLDEILLEDACRFEFFQAVRLLERLRPDRTPVGRHESPDEEVVWFRSHPSLAFPASQLFELKNARRPSKKSRLEMTVNFMGLV